jgi:NACHT domain- and WD repeat-containing protein
LTSSSRTFRVFVSSTFSDLREERDALQQRVFPKLRELCKKYGCSFQAIDLRWGVSNEASLNQQTLNICLREIARSQHTSPRPNFIVLLGNRFGWCPPPSQIPSNEFEKILGAIKDLKDAELLKEWYRLDKNAIPFEWRLKSRELEGQYANYDQWEPVETRLHNILSTAVKELNFSVEQQLPYVASATEQEIAAGALGVKKAPEHVLCFFRTITGLPKLYNSGTEDFLDLNEKDHTVNEEKQRKIDNLKKRLVAYLPCNVQIYQAQWTTDGITNNHINRLCNDVLNSLWRIILEEIEHPYLDSTIEIATHIHPDEALDNEGIAHCQFAEQSLRFFVGRREMLTKIARYLKENQRYPLAIVGAGGTGKSALIARAIQQTRESNPKAEIVYRFIGVTPSSSEGRSLLYSLCREIARRYNLSDINLAIDYNSLVPELGKRMRQATADKPLILFLDSIDQLSNTQEACKLIWLPNELPEHVHVIVSTRPEQMREILLMKHIQTEELTGLSLSEGNDLLSQWLTSVNRALQPAQRKEVLSKFALSDYNPLYLRLAFEQAKLWTSDSGEPSEQLALGIRGIIQKNLIRRLAKESNHGKVLVSRALGYLAASRYGLAEDELIDLLSRDVQVYGWFLENSYHFPRDLIERAISFRCNHPTQQVKNGQPSVDENAAIDWLKEIRTSLEKREEFLTEILPKEDGPRLPIALWSRLYFDLELYLTERVKDGSSLLNFYHRELGEVSVKEFLGLGEKRLYHARLADYFRFKTDPHFNRSWTGRDLHGLSELPYHLTAASQYEEAYRTLTDFNFLEHKVAEVDVLERKDENGNLSKIFTGVFQLQEDFERLLNVLTEGGCEPIGDHPIGDHNNQTPLIVTAVESDAGLSVYCPVCNKTSHLEKGLLDKEITCPQEGCNTRLKVNPFVIKRPK